MWRGGCVALLGEEPTAALTVRHTCPSLETSAKHRRAGRGVYCSSFHYGALCCSLKSIDANVWQGEGVWHHTLLSSLERGIQACFCSGNPHRRANNLPSFVPGIPQVPAFTLSVSEHPSGAVLLCFISGIPAGFQNSKF